MSRLCTARRWTLLLTGLALALPAAGAVAAEPSPDIAVKQNSSDAIIPGSIACTNEPPTKTHENHYFRRFDLAGSFNASAGFRLSVINIGVEAVEVVDRVLPWTLAAWAIDPGDPLTLANLELLRSGDSFWLDTDDGQVIGVGFEPTVDVPAGKDLVIEVATPDYNAGEKFYIGSNTQPQSAPGYLRAPTCSVNEPTATADFGFPNMHMVLWVTGKAQECLTAEGKVPAAETASANAKSAVISAQAAVTTAKAAVAKAKKKLKAAKATGVQTKIAKAKKKLKRAKARLRSAQAALTAATTKATAAKNALTALNALVAAECAQPVLPATSRASRPTVRRDLTPSTPRRAERPSVPSSPVGRWSTVG